MGREVIYVFKEKIMFIIIFIFSLVIISIIFTSCYLLDLQIGNQNNEISFMFYVFDPGHEEILWENFAKELKNKLNENMIWTAPPYFWSELEPANNQFNWNELDNFVSENSTKYRVINMGPEIMANGCGGFYIAGDIPDWIDNDYSNPQLKEQFGELLQAIISRYQDDIHMWWIGLEVNLGGDGLSWELWKDWLKWEVNLIKEIDPDAKIAISFGSWADYHEQMPLNAIHEVDGIMELINEGIDFEVIAIEYHYGTLQYGDINDLEQALSDIKTTGKEIFIWEVFYPGGTDLKYQNYWDWKYPPEGSYTEEWQADQLYKTLKLAYEDDQIIGINLFHFQEITYEDIDPTEWEAGWRCYAGMVKADGAPKEAYHKIRDYWNAVLK